MSTTYSPRVPMHVATEAAYNAAEEAQLALLAQHGYPEGFPSNWSRTCKCGRIFSTTNGLGLHSGAVTRQADKAWEAAYEASLARAGY